MAHRSPLPLAPYPNSVYTLYITSLSYETRLSLHTCALGRRLLEARLALRIARLTTPVHWEREVLPELASLDIGALGKPLAESLSPTCDSSLGACKRHCPLKLPCELGAAERTDAVLPFREGGGIGKSLAAINSSDKLSRLSMLAWSFL